MVLVQALFLVLVVSVLPLVLVLVLFLALVLVLALFLYLVMVLTLALDDSQEEVPLRPGNSCSRKCSESHSSVASHLGGIDVLMKMFRMKKFLHRFMGEKTLQGQFSL